MAFAHLHVHTEYSLLDGMSRISEIPEYIKALGMDSVAITDHGAMFGVVDFYKACKKAGVHPVIGCEVYTAARTMDDKDPDHDRHSGHLILLAETQEGYQNLIKIDSEAYTRGLYYKPRVDKALLRKYHEGIICLSACLAGNVQYRLSLGDYEGAKEEALELLDIFGENNFFLELQNHNLPEDQRVISGLVDLSKDIGVPLVATNDSHYTRREDSKAHDVLLAIGTNSDVAADDRLRFDTDEFYLKSEEEMREMFPGLEDAIDRSEEIAKRCNVEFTFGEYHIPDYDPPEGLTTTEYLRKLCNEGLRKRYGEEADDPESVPRKRLERELGVIESMGYVEYFLIVWDFIHYAKSHDIPVGPGRGSAAGSIVAYSIEITEIDPLKYNLIFERFLNPERVSMPDIDVDFDIERRQDVIDYVVRKYGRDNVSQIITFGTMKAKMAVRDVARALGAPYSTGDAIAKAIPNELGITLKKALEASPELEEMYEGDSDIKEIIDMSIALEGLPRHASTHAAGVVISKKPLDEYVPLYYSESKGIATQFNMTTIEELGLLKMDFLGLRNLTVLRNALDMIEKDTGRRIDFSKMEYDDPKVYEMISEGNTQGVFQLESGGMTDFMKNLRPSCFEDIVAGISLYRPGPMDSIPKYIDNKKHPDHIKYIDPHLAHILDVTYGCMVYQEQVMQVVRDLGGYSYGRADLVRRAMSKKKQDVMQAERQYFVHGKKAEDGSVEIPGCIANGIPEDAANAIFDDMISFAQYAFNKSHAAAYAVVSYETAYLKCYYPREFMAALMTSMMGDERHISSYIRNCREMGIEVLPPSIAKSEAGFSVEYEEDDVNQEHGSIRFGLLGVKHVGTGIVNAIIEARERNGVPRDIYEFIGGLDSRELNKKALECLIKAGALDCLNPNRAAHLAVYEEVVSSAQTSAKRSNKDQLSLFQLDDQVMETVAEGRKLPDIKNFDRKTLLAMEKEQLGVYLTGHPLDEYRDLIKDNVTAMTTDLIQDSAIEMESADENESEVADYMASRTEKKFKDGDRVVMAGMITAVRTMITKKGQEMARVTLEDFGGIINLIVFPKVFEQYRHKLQNDQVVAVGGRLSFQDGGDAELLADSFADIDKIAEFAASEGSGRSNYNSSGGRSGYSGGGNYSGYNKSGRNSGGRNGQGLIKIRVTQQAQDEAGGVTEVLSRIDGMIRGHRGRSSVRVYLPDGRSVVASPGHGVGLDDGLRAELEGWFGRDNVKC